MPTKKTKTTGKKKVKKKIDMEDLLGEVRARFDVLEEKLDTLLSKMAVISRLISTEQDSGFKTHATVTKKFPIPRNHIPRERKMYKVVCAQCNKECEVPFMPRAGRPVYCKTCFSNRRKDSRPINIPDREELVAEISKTLNIDITKPAKTKAVKTKVSKAKATKSKVSKAKATKSKVSKAKATKSKVSKTKKKK